MGKKNVELDLKFRDFHLWLQKGEKYGMTLRMFREVKKVRNCVWFLNDEIWYG